MTGISHGEYMRALRDGVDPFPKTKAPKAPKSEEPKPKRKPRKKKDD